MEVPLTTTVLGLNEPQVRPVGTVSVRLTEPENPLSPDTVMVGIPFDPLLTCTLAVEVRLKSTTRTVIVTEWERTPLVPVSVIVYVPVFVVLNDTWIEVV